MSDDLSKSKQKLPKGAATRVFLRGLSISLPPILTLLILLWVGRGLNDYIIKPIGDVVRWSIAKGINQIQAENDLLPSRGLPPLPHWEDRYRITAALQNRVPEIDEEIAQRQDSDDNEQSRGEVWTALVREDSTPDTESLASNIYVPMGGGYIPLYVYKAVEKQNGPAAMPPTAMGAYMDYVTTQYFYSFWHLSALAILLSIVGVYFVGRLVTVRLGGWFVHKLETGVLAHLPVISNIYSAVKQVTDFLLTEREVEYSRVIAVEYPRRGIWSLGLVTGDSMKEITTATGEPMISVLIPSSPMPVTGYTMNVPRSEVVDLDLTVDQAFQFCISCGVLVPPQQKVTPELLQKEFGKQLPAALPAARDEDSSTFPVRRDD